MKRIVLGLLAATAMSAGAFAADIKPAIIYDLGGKFDKSFNEAAFNGAEKFKTETGIEYRDFEIQNDAQREQALRKFAEDGNNPIVMAGFSWEAALKKVAAEFPDLQFAIIDMVVDKPNVRSVVYKEQEGSYIVGEGRNGHRCCGQQAQDCTLHVIHTLSVVFPLRQRHPAVLPGGRAACGRSVCLPLGPHIGTAESKFHLEF